MASPPSWAALLNRPQRLHVARHRLGRMAFRFRPTGGYRPLPSSRFEDAYRPQHVPTNGLQSTLKSIWLPSQHHEHHPVAIKSFSHSVFLSLHFSVRRDRPKKLNDQKIYTIVSPKPIWLGALAYFCSASGDVVPVHSLGVHRMDEST